MELNRRTLVRSTAWTAPAVAVATAAPAYAATGQAGALEWTFTAATATLPGAAAAQCNNLVLTFDNSRSSQDLVPTKVYAEAKVFGSWQGMEQPNSEAIKAGAIHTMSVDTSTYSGFELRFTVTFANAAGTTVTAQTAGNLKTGGCGTQATFTHKSAV